MHEGLEEGFLLLDILHQPGEMDADRVAVFVDQALERPETEAGQQQRQAQQDGHAFVQAQRAAGQVFQQGVVLFHARVRKGVGASIPNEYYL
ncbi:hypothetical protein D9M71_387950 [compost metagenome]